MAKKWALDDLRKMSVHERAVLHKNACHLGHTAEGAALKTLIEEAGLPYSEDRCLTMNDPITIKMQDIIQSKEGRKAALAATKMGQPAMAGIAPLLQVALGSDYGAHNMGTATAGGLVGQLMQSLGYKKIGERSLPADCVAKTAAMWG